MNFQYKLFLSISLSMLLASRVRAEEVPELRRFFEKQLEPYFAINQPPPRAIPPSGRAATPSVEEDFNYRAEWEHYREEPDHTPCLTEACLSARSGEGWYFRNIMVRFRGRIAFEVPGLADLELQPEMELFFQRGWPTGYRSYLPPDLRH